MNEDGLLSLRIEIAKACRIIGKLEITNHILGHISVRIPGSDNMLIRARGPAQPGMRFTQPDDVIRVDMDGRKIDGKDGLSVPNEIHIHSWIYRTRPDVNSVLHAHPATVVVLAACGKPLQPIFGAFNPTSIRLWSDGIPVYPRSVLVNDDDLGREFVSVLRDHRACIMRGHGITTCGPNVEETTLTAIALNDLAEMNYKAYLIGVPEPIPEDEIAAVVAVNQRVKAAGGAPLWRYYCDLLGES